MNGESQALLPSGFEWIELDRMRQTLWDFYAHTNERRVLPEEISRVAEFTEHDSMIDIGCGEGDLVLLVHDRIDSCVALDPDVQRLNVLRTRIGPGSNVVFVGKTFEDYLTEKKFDVTVSSHTFSFFKNKFEMLEKMISITKEKGRLVLVLHSKDGEQVRLLESVNKDILKQDLTHFCAETLCDYLRKGGYHVTLQIAETKSIFDTVEEVLKMSYFFFRKEYQELSDREKGELEGIIGRHMVDGKITIRTLHGIVLVNPQHGRHTSRTHY